MAIDVIGRAINVDDIVVFYNNVYKVIKVPETNLNSKYAQIRIILFNKSKTTTPQTKRSGDCCLISKEDALIWMLTQHENN